MENSNYKLDYATIEDLYALLKNSYEGNKDIHKVEVILDDGTKPVKIVFETSKDSKGRIGKLEAKI
ncbi:MAG: hypothetical protein WCT51_04465 [Candidatus Shapirobacteria bacterium]|jgi:hypothetical protein